MEILTPPNWIAVQVDEWVDPTEGNGGGDFMYWIELRFRIPGRRTFFGRIKPSYFKTIFKTQRYHHKLSTEASQGYVDYMWDSMEEYSRLYHGR